MITARHTEDSWWTFECRYLESKQNQVFKYQMLGILEAMDAAASKLKDPKDTFLIDNQGRWKIMTRGQIDKAMKYH